MTRPATTGRTEREWAPRVWEGCDFVAWARLLVRNRFAVGLPYLYIAVIITFVSACNTVARLVQEILYGRRVRETRLPAAPLFILGHWRTGTTLLHELLILDERHTYPTTFQCLMPNHFLISEGFMKSWLPSLMPSRRPMDNMKAGLDRPQEDEFALCMMGQPSPYLTVAFPNRPPQDQEAFALDGLPRPAVAAWKRAFLLLLKRVTFRVPKRLVLKSPTHTFRLRVLRELFPDAHYVHIVRDPYVVFPSTVNLWKTLYETHGLQRPTFAGLEEHVFETFNRMYRTLEETRSLIDPSRFHELRYEDLVRDPLGEMRKLYDRLGLGEYDKVEPRLKTYLEANADYRTNRYEMTPALREEIARRWGDVMRRYGYDGAS